MGTFMHAVEDEMLCSSLISDRVPYFNAPIYLQNKSVIGKVDEILGPINEVYFSVKMGEGMVASSFKQGDKVYIGGDKLLPIERFLPKPKVAGMLYSIALSTSTPEPYSLGVTSTLFPLLYMLPIHCRSSSERGRGIARGSGPRGRGAPGGRGRGGRGASRGGVRGGFSGDRGGFRGGFRGGSGRGGSGGFAPRGGRGGFRGS
ncbi:Gar1/Naf1 RNA binding region-domain-containing protein [Suillus americanus]|nr:Gar1/Naf1 RNA binding region-domain-containing protein [Suillus americanus]